MKDKSTVFAGFVDGYKARNIATSTSSIKYHFDEIKSSVPDIIAAQRNKGAPVDLIQYLDRLEKILSVNITDFLSVAISCGEVLKTIIIIAKQNLDQSGILTDEKMKRIVYHYLEVAELSGDKTIGDLAIMIAENF